MKIGKTLAVLVPLVLLGTSACGGDTDTESAPADTDSAAEAEAPQQQQQQMDPETMALMGEAQELQQQLAPIQEEAMQDEALAAQLQELQERVQAAMRDENPELLERMDELEADFMAAQESGDQERVQEVGMEAQAVQGELQALQSAVLEDPELSASVQAFEDVQRERMIEIDPEAGELIDRLDEIFEQLEMR